MFAQLSLILRSEIPNHLKIYLMPCIKFHFQTTAWIEGKYIQYLHVLIDFSLSVKAATLIFIYGRGSAISSAKEGKSSFIYNLVKS